jgi:hypothetical protein
MHANAALVCRWGDCDGLAQLIHRQNLLVCQPGDIGVKCGLAN